MTRSTGLESHPDLLEMRARYERAGQSPAAGFLNGVLVLSAIYLAISPWIVGFNDTGFRLTINDLIVGGGLLALVAGYSLAFGRTHTLTWVAPLVGIWVIISPWVIFPSTATPHLWISNVCVGGVIALAGLAMAAMGAFEVTRKRR